MAKNNLLSTCSSPILECIRKGILLITLLALPLFSLAQKGNKPPKNPVKQAQKEEAAKEKQLDKDIKDLKKDYKKLQDKKIRKRMKSNKKRARRYDTGRKEPWHKRWFRRDPRKKKVRG